MTYELARIDAASRWPFVLSGRVRDVLAGHGFDELASTWSLACLRFPEWLIALLLGMLVAWLCHEIVVPVGYAFCGGVVALGEGIFIYSGAFEFFGPTTVFTDFVWELLIIPFYFLGAFIVECRPKHWRLSVTDVLAFTGVVAVGLAISAYTPTLGLPIGVLFLFASLRYRALKRCVQASVLIQ